MNLGAMADLGVSKCRIIGELKKLNLGGWDISFTEDSRGGIFGTKAEVVIGGRPEHGHCHCHESGDGDCHGEHCREHAHGERENCHCHEHSHQDAAPLGAEKAREHAHGEHGHCHEHRSFADIKKIIEDSDISLNAKKIALNIFSVIASAEAKIHNKSEDEVHFHEVGALDSIIDIVGAAICADILKADKVLCSPIELGGGTARCAHGVMPVPAPATAEILKGAPVKLNGSPHECTTPTGAAIIMGLGAEFSKKIEGKILAAGIGIGGRNPKELPNLLRVLLVETENAPETKGEKMFVAETNIDDMTPESLAYACERLFAAGASDVWQESVAMKKSRLAAKLCALSSPEKLDSVLEALVKNTTTLGVRISKVERISAGRQIVKKSTSLGEASFKKSDFYGVERLKPEFDDCKKIAEAHGIPVFKAAEILKNEFKDR